MHLGLHFGSKFRNRFLRIFSLCWDVCLFEGRKLIKSMKDDEEGNLVL